MNANIQKYLAFIKTVECGSFTKAAELLNYTQSAVSRMINDLEKEWNVSLLERGRAGVRLTSDGMKILPFAQILPGGSFGYGDFTPWPLLLQGSWTSLRNRSR